MCGDCGKACLMTNFQNARHIMICKECFDRLPPDQRHDRSTTKIIYGPPVMNERITPEQVRQFPNTFAHSGHPIFHDSLARLGCPDIETLFDCLATQMEQDIADVAKMKKALEQIIREGTARDAEIANTALSNSVAGKMCDLECGDRFFKGLARCRHGRTSHESIKSLFSPVIPQVITQDNHDAPERGENSNE